MFKILVLIDQLGQCTPVQTDGVEAFSPRSEEKPSKHDADFKQGIRKKVPGESIRT